MIILHHWPTGTQMSASESCSNYEALFLSTWCTLPPTECMQYQSYAGLSSCLPLRRCTSLKKPHEEITSLARNKTISQHRRASVTGREGCFLPVWQTLWAPGLCPISRAKLSLHIICSLWKFCLTMWSDQSVASQWNKDNIITLWLSSSSAFNQFYPQTCVTQRCPHTLPITCIWSFDSWL